MDGCDRAMRNNITAALDRKNAKLKEQRRRVVPIEEVERAKEELKEARKEGKGRERCGRRSDGMECCWNANVLPAVEILAQCTNYKRLKKL